MLQIYTPTLKVGDCLQVETTNSIYLFWQKENGLYVQGITNAGVGRWIIPVQCTIIGSYGSQSKAETILVGEPLEFVVGDDFCVTSVVKSIRRATADELEKVAKASSGVNIQSTNATANDDHSA